MILARVVPIRNVNYLEIDFISLCFGNAFFCWFTNVSHYGGTTAILTEKGEGSDLNSCLFSSSSSSSSSNKNHNNKNLIVSINTPVIIRANRNKILDMISAL